jgi:hypothetical protein
MVKEMPYRMYKKGDQKLSKVLQAEKITSKIGCKCPDA